jgi:hypothetical protein
VLRPAKLSLETSSRRICITTSAYRSQILQSTLLHTSKTVQKLSVLPRYAPGWSLDAILAPHHEKFFLPQSKSRSVCSARFHNAARSCTEPMPCHVRPAIATLTSPSEFSSPKAHHSPHQNHRIIAPLTPPVRRVCHSTPSNSIIILRPPRPNPRRCSLRNSRIPLDG